jgi:hypothetical protein
MHRPPMGVPCRAAVSSRPILRCLGIARSTLRRHYRSELDIGHIPANAAVAQNLYYVATGTGREAVAENRRWLVGIFGSTGVEAARQERSGRGGRRDCR